MKTVCFSFLLAFILNTSNGQTTCGSKDIAKVDSCLIGKTIDDAIKTLGVDTFNFQPIRLFAREIYGIYIRRDSANITIVVEKPYVMSDMELNSNSFKESYKFIAKSKIQWICWQRKRAYRRVGKYSFVGCQSY